MKQYAKTVSDFEELETQKVKNVIYLAKISSVAMMSQQVNEDFVVFAAFETLY